MIKKIALLALISVSFSCCNYPGNVAEVVKSSKNRLELEKVINHYKTMDDPLMLQAAYFLIGNMKNKYGMAYRYKNDRGDQGVHYYMEARDYGSLQRVLDSLAKKDPSYHWRREGAYDKDAITAENLIETIDYSFKVWREMPWASKLTFAEFCEYILPYRVSNEPFSNWRKHLYEKYKWVVDSVKDKNNPVEACILINRELAKWLTFHYPLNQVQGKRTVLETESYKKGTCVDISNYATSVMRAVGIPVAVDFTPSWADRANGHNWNVVFSSEGKAIRFNAADCNALPGNYNITAKMAKIFRYTFEDQKESLPQIVLNNSDYKDISIPVQLNNTNAIDVTEQYNTVTDCSIKLKDANIDYDIAYLSVYNQENWRPLGWSYVKDNSVTFKNMGVNILYELQFNKNKNSTSDAIPLILKSDKTIQKIVCNQDSLIDLHATAHNIVLVYEYVALQNIEANKDYILYYWDKEWVEHSKLGTHEGSMTFKKVPSNALYKLQCVGIPTQYTRPFTYCNEKQIFW